MDIINLFAIICIITQFACVIFRQSFAAQWVSIASFVYCAIFQLKVLDSMAGFIVGLCLAAMVLFRVVFIMAPKETQE